MKKIFSTLVLGAMSLCAFADNTDQVSAKIVSNSGGKAVIAVVVNYEDSDNPITAFGVDIKLPTGMTIAENPAINTTENIYYTSSKKGAGNHIVSSSVDKAGDGILRVAGISEANHSFEKLSGEIFRFTANVSSSATVEVVAADLITKPMESFKFNGATKIDGRTAQYLLDSIADDSSDFEGVDVNGDGSIDARDAQYLLDYSVGALYE